MHVFVDHDLFVYSLGCPACLLASLISLSIWFSVCFVFFWQMEFAKRCGIPAVNKNVWKIYGNMIEKKSSQDATPSLDSFQLISLSKFTGSKAVPGQISSKNMGLIVLGSYRLYYLIAIPGPLLKQKGRYWGCKIYVKIWSTLRKLRWVVASTCLLKSLWTNPGKVVCYSAQLFFFASGHGSLGGFSAMLLG